MPQSYEDYSNQEEELNAASIERPGFYDLQRHAEASFVKRALTRYFTTRNYERSIKWHTRLGTPVVRKVVMGTVGRLNSRPGGGGNYRLDHSKSRIEAATNFAYRGSVYNEAVHTVAAMPAAAVVLANVAESRFEGGFVANTAVVTFNLALVALQRYNRARMIKRVNEELKGGSTYDPYYENWAGIDSRAVDNYEASLIEADSSVQQSNSMFGSVVDTAGDTPPIIPEIGNLGTASPS